MNRPDHPALDAIEEAIRDVRQCEEKLKAAQTRLSASAREIANIDDTQKRLDVAIWAYWYLPIVSATDLSWGATGREHQSHLLKHAGPIAANILCDRCDKQVPVRSRAQMAEMQARLADNQQRWAEGYRVLCPLCEERVHAERREKYEQRDAAEQARCERLRRMPYADYLKTPDWQAILQDHVDFVRRERKEQEIPCALCDGELAVGAYHKTTRNLGREGSDDLVLLGTRCLDLVMEKGLIVGRPAPEHALSRCKHSDFD